MKILIRNEQNKKWELVESSAYAAEKELQDLLAASPEIVSMDEINPGAGSLVAAVREFNLPVGFIDILAFTVRGDIAIIECKLAANAQVKREVIGQILDYAAHLWGMSYEDLDAGVQNRENRSLADLVRDGSGDPEWDEEAFRTRVRLALERGDFILTIVVNEINDELNRIVRYVNSAGAPAFSFAALEMRRFHNSRVEMLVPHVFGPAVSAAKAKLESSKWGEESFFDTLREQGSEAELVGRKILLWAEGRVTRIYWGEGTVNGSFVPILVHNNRKHQLFAVYTTGVVETYFSWYLRKPPFDSDEKRMELFQRLNQIPGISLPKDGFNKRPSVKLTLLKKKEALEEFLSAYDWFVDEVSAI